jgi:diguanylate cyclase (GGDEF)-like protein
MRNRALVSGLGYWTANLILHVTGRAIYLFGFPHHPQLSLLFGNLVALAGSVLFLFGLAAFTNTAIRKNVYLILSFLGAVVISLITFLVDNQLYVSILYTSVSLALIIRYLVLFWKNRSQNSFYNNTIRVLFGIYTLFGILSIIRIASDTIQLTQQVILTTYQSPAIAMSQFFMLIILAMVNFCILILVNNKLLHDLTLEGKAKSLLVDTLKLQAEHDSLTGLYNRNGMERELETHFQHVSEETPLLIGLADVDDFKHINDTCGHEIGDRVLMHMGRIFSSCEQNGIQVSRWGGDEFLFLMQQQASSSPAAQFNYIRQKIEQGQWHLVLPEPQAHITISIGYVRLTQPVPIHKVLRCCDEHLYQAKRSGKNRVIGKVLHTQDETDTKLTCQESLPLI